jgi:hypothetical protein
VSAGQTANLTATLQVVSQADSVLVTAPRLQGDAEAVNVERMAAQIVQVEAEGVITSLPKYECGRRRGPSAQRLSRAR